MKYGIWNVSQPAQEAVNSLAAAGYSPMVSMVLAARNITSPRQAQEYLSCDGELPSPFLMTDMQAAVQRIRQALERREKIAVFGDYDVDGITATCLMTDFLRRQEGYAIAYIPGRLEEGYGLNEIAIEQLYREGIRLIITVDCGITALAEARLCRKKGIDLIITDHHECKEMLPNAVAVVDPHRPDDTYPHKNLSGVGVAFKLAAAISGDQEQMLREYADLVCLGTVADVMPLQGENRVFVSHGLKAMEHTTRPGLAALMTQCGCDPADVTVSSVGYTLAPRINAAGRIGQVELALELFLTRDPERAKAAAAGLCDLNRQRQAVEADIYQQAVQMLPTDRQPHAIVLAEESWHQGVVGIVASRIAEEYCCPTFLICLDGEHGKASSRSYGGFNLFCALRSLQKYLESYGGHELAAGFTIHRDQIPAFRREICRLAEEYYSTDIPRTQLDCDCWIPPELMTAGNIESLSVLEPCGNGCPRPVLAMERVIVERTSQVGGGKHMRLQLHCGNYSISAIYFSATPQSCSIAPGDVVDVAFHPQINEYRGIRSVQMNMIDIRPSCRAECSWEAAAYRAMIAGELTAQHASSLLPERHTLVMIWRYLSCFAAEPVREEPLCLCRKIVRWTQQPLSLGQMLTCLDIFADVGLLRLEKEMRMLTVQALPSQEKRDLKESQTMKRLLAAKE